MERGGPGAPARGAPAAGARAAAYFAPRAAGYAAFRPTYPAELFDWLAALAPGRALAWDCATGSGQAARALAAHFDRVVATDASPEQLAHATPNAHVEYRVAPAEASGLPDACADLVTVAQALHWFDLDAFYAEAARVLAPGGALAVWSYGDPVLGEAALDAAFRDAAAEVVAYWPPERRFVGDGYMSISFPFTERPAPAFRMERDWTLAEFAGYAGTWSAATRFAAATGRDATAALTAALAPAWGDPGRRVPVRWPLTVRAGHRPDTPTTLP